MLLNGIDFEKIMAQAGIARDDFLHAYEEA